MFQQKNGPQQIEKNCFAKEGKKLRMSPRVREAARPVRPAYGPVKVSWPPPPTFPVFLHFPLYIASVRSPSKVGWVVRSPCTLYVWHYVYTRSFAASVKCLQNICKCDLVFFFSLRKTQWCNRFSKRISYEEDIYLNKLHVKKKRIWMGFLIIL